MMNQVMWSPGVTLENLEEQVIKAALTYNRGNKVATANSLGIAVRTLDNKLDKYREDEAKENERSDTARRDREDFLRRQRGIPVGAQFDTAATPSLSSPAMVPSSSGGPAARLGVEPVANTGKEPTMPVSQRSEVQTMLPYKSPHAGSAKRR